jgi:hypothetical protein
MHYDQRRRRLWLLGARIHHGAAGAVLMMLGGVLMWHDRRDAPWVRDTV